MRRKISLRPPLSERYAATLAAFLAARATTPADHEARRKARNRRRNVRRRRTPGACEPVRGIGERAAKVLRRAAPYLPPEFIETRREEMRTWPARERGAILSKLRRYVEAMRAREMLKDAA